MLGAKDAFSDGQEGCVLVAGPGGVARLPGVPGEVRAGPQGRSVCSAMDALWTGNRIT